MVFNSAMKVVALVSSTNHLFVAKKNEEIPSVCIICIEAYLFLVNILHYGSVLCIVTHDCNNFFLMYGFGLIISWSLHY